MIIATGPRMESSWLTHTSDALHFDAVTQNSRSRARSSIRTTPGAEAADLGAVFRPAIGMRAGSFHVPARVSSSSGAQPRPWSVEDPSGYADRARRSAAARARIWLSDTWPTLRACWSRALRKQSLRAAPMARNPPPPPSEAPSDRGPVPAGRASGVRGARRISPTATVNPVSLLYCRRRQEAICRDLGLTPLHFNRVLRRARETLPGVAPYTTARGIKDLG